MTYRLLRDNKESGPFSEEEMIAKGFKPYDLIWVEGKSAGWRYPSEIPAFKNFAPVVEEQPYDRFYKKQPAQKLFIAGDRYAPSTEKTDNSKPIFTGEREPAQQRPATVQPEVQPTPLPEYKTPDYNIRPASARHIHVTLPSGNTVNLTTLVSNKNGSGSAPAEIKIPAAAEKIQPAIAQPVYQPTIPVINETNIAPASMPANNFNSLSANQPVNRFAGLSWGLIAASFIGFATLVGLGIMIGLAISREKNDLAFNQALNNKSKQAVQPGVNSYPNPSAAATPGTDGVTDNEASVVPVSSGKELVQNAVVKNNLPPENEETKEAQKLPGDKKDAAHNPLLNRKEETVIAPKTVSPPADLEKSLQLTANDFKTGAFGGITGLKYTLLNSSKFPLESVEVELNYIQANDKVFKTEKIIFKDIPPGAQLTVEAPSSNRGVKMSGRILKVNAKEAIVNTTARS